MVQITFENRNPKTVFRDRDPWNREMELCLLQRRLLFEILLNVLPCGREAQGIGPT